MFFKCSRMFSNSSTLQMDGVGCIYRPPSLVAIAPMVSRNLRITGRTNASGRGSVGSSGHSQPEVAIEILTADAVITG